MRLLITGGTGFVGAHVVRAALQRGWQVRCLVRPTSPRAALEGLDVECVDTDLADQEAVFRALRGCEAVAHVAGSFEHGPGALQRMRAVHVEATSTLIRGAEAAGVARFVLCSSSITLGWGSPEAPADEESPLPDPDRSFGRDTPLRSYFETKSAAERLVLQACSRGLEGMVVIPDYVIGAWDSKPTSGAILVQMGSHWVPFYPRGGKCFITASDCGLGHILALEHGVPGQRYLLGTHNLMYREFMQRAARIMGVRPPLFPLPRAAGRLVGLAGALLRRLDRHRFALLDRQVVEATQSIRFRDGSRAERELGLVASPIEEGIEDAVRWFRDHGYLKACKRAL
jgi:dihydroflavonol-4-reductase